MNTYLTLISINWQNGLVYKTSLLLWRFRQLLSSIMALTLWTVIYQGGETSFNYTQAEMITFVFVSGILQSLILSTMMHSLAQRVYSGEISNTLLKPINIFGFLFTQEIADKAKNAAFIIIESLILFVAFRPSLVWPSLTYFILCLGFSMAGIMLHFLFQLLLGSLGFWTPESWGPRFIFFMILQVAAGKLFPLDILPQFFQDVLYWTPFPYLSFIQTQLFLERVVEGDVLKHAIALLGWLFISTLLTRKVWLHGMKDYAAAGQ